MAPHAPIAPTTPKSRSLFVMYAAGEPGGSYKAKAAKVMGFFTATVLDYFHFMVGVKKRSSWHLPFGLPKRGGEGPQ